MKLIKKLPNLSTKIKQMIVFKPNDLYKIWWSYRCVPSINCKQVEIDENNLASCGNQDPRAVQKICCKDLVETPKQCSSYKARR